MYQHRTGNIISTIDEALLFQSPKSLPWPEYADVKFEERKEQVDRDVVGRLSSRETVDR
jgi:hypothetical protein